MYIYFFNGGVLANRKIYKHLEAMIYKAAGIKTVVMPYGSDSIIPECSFDFCFSHVMCQYYNDFYKTRHERVA